MGWQPVAFSEIEPFPSAVLKHHYPHVPNVGDMTKFKEWNLEPIDLLVGGTPCQSFSVAGLRKGLDDPRGNLMLTFLAIAERERPKWIVWENVPGVLSSNGGRDFGTFLAALGELGYGWAYRVLDAQWFGVAQRRRRVFVVGCLGDQAGAAKVLFESESVQRNPAPSREARKGAARGVGGGPADGSIAFVDVGATLKGGSGARGYPDPSDGNGHNMVAQPVAFHPTQDPISSVDVCHALSGGSKQGTASAAVAQPVVIAFSAKDHGADAGELSPTLRAMGHGSSHANGGGQVAVAQPVAFTRCDNGQDAATDVTPTMRCGSNYSAHLAVAQPVALGTDCYNGAITGEVAATIGTPGSSVNASGPTVMQAVDVKQVQWASGGGQVENDTAQALRAGAEYNYQFARVAMQVRRLTPTECERLQGFPDGYTAIPIVKPQPIKGQPAVVKAAADGPRYKALGNSMAVPCMKWIGERIQAVIERQEVQP
jgi:DNA (cytosine-5)-methyltransferase 1